MLTKNFSLRTRLLFLLLFSIGVHGNELLVEKQLFSADTFTTVGGEVIENVRLGWESYGTLNADKSNAILITHYFTGNSHAAGKYKSSDEASGYWNDIIGPDKAIDTNRFFVISMDTFANVGVHNPNVITTGPASISPKTGQPYGLSFPVVTIGDFVNVQHALIESLGIQKLAAVVGPSMGSFQALEWGIRYPHKVDKIISVIGAGYLDPWSQLTLESWASPIRLDKNWNNGQYYENDAPLDGLTASLMLITQNALSPMYINSVKDDLMDFTTAMKTEINTSVPAVEWLENRARLRAKSMDANHVLYLVKACQLFISAWQQDKGSRLAKIQAKALFMPAKTDVLLRPALLEDVHNTLLELGKTSNLVYLDSDMGHLDGIIHIKTQAETIANFLQ